MTCDECGGADIQWCEACMGLEIVPEAPKDNQHRLTALEELAKLIIDIDEKRKGKKTFKEAADKARILIPWYRVK